MTQSLSKMYVHIIFRIPNKGIQIRSNESNQLYAYIGGVIKKTGCIPILINGMPDHIHILCVLSKNIALSLLLEEIKRNSSRWIKTKGTYYNNFAWQGGYGVFSVSASVCTRTQEYIAQQSIHHKRMSFKDEYLKYLDEYGVDYNEDYLWRD